MRTIKDENGHEIQVDLDTLPEELMFALVQNDPVHEPDKMLKAHTERAQAI